MGINTLTQKTGQVPITNDWYNDLLTALKNDLVPRNANGIPQDEAGSIGNLDYQWANGRFKRLFLNGDLVTPSEYTGKPHRINSGAENADGSPDFMTPAGAAGGLSCTIEATTTPLDMLINSSELVLSSDIIFSSLTAAPATNNTCLINDANLTGANTSKILGEYDRKPIVIDTIGSEISAKDGEIGAFKVNSEVFLATIDTTNNKLWPILRGYAGTSRGTLSNNDTITLLSMNSLLLKIDGSTKVSSDYYPESVSVAPAAGTAGKIYLERSTNKIGYDTGSVIDYDYILLGFAICDSADCLFAEHQDFELYWLPDIAADYHIKNGTTITIQNESFISVNGKRITVHEDFDITQASNMDSGESITASTLFYLYMDKNGLVVISGVHPRKFSSIKRGFYHPLKYYRCIGACFTNSSSDFVFKSAERKSNETVFDHLPPIGTIIPWVPGSYGNGSNGSFSSLDGYDVADFLPDNWRFCDGSEYYDGNSPIFNTTGKYLPNLTDNRFLIGSNSIYSSDAVNIGETGGANEHQHNMSHIHQWCYMYNYSGSNYAMLSTRSQDGSTYSWTTGGDTVVQYQASQVASGSDTYRPLVSIGAIDEKHFTGGAIANPSSGDDSNGYDYPDNAGATVLTGKRSNIPLCIGCFYIMRVK